MRNFISVPGALVLGLSAFYHSGCGSSSNPASSPAPVSTPGYSTTAVTVVSGPSTFTPRSISYYNGNLWVTNTYTAGGALQEFTTSGLSVTAISAYNGSATFGGLTQTNIGPDGTLYVGDYGNSQIEVLSPTGAYQTVITGLTKVEGVAVNSAGTTLYVSEANTPPAILVYSIISTTTQKTFNYIGSFSTTSSGPGALMSPGYLALDSSNNVYVANMAVPSNAIKYGPSGGSQVSFTASGLTLPIGIGVDRAGNVLVAQCSLPGYIQEFNPSASGTAFTAGVTFGNNYFQGPEGIAFDDSKNLYVASVDNNQILEFKYTP